ncbi:uncharacterized protein LOC120424006 [Culex pipiens pallens]|uniref:uncharacterized protein LOC120424006 n=1 Tax=Culex pipiens pallens TaxID=42434 RepID=UPI001954EEC4|nr:uncharacterized protein LOC120424006 [Culex pipiens pallens]
MIALKNKPLKMLSFDEIVDAFRVNLLEKLVKKHGPQPFECRWAELVETEYDQKVALVTQLIRSGVDCDWQNDKGKSPMELALALNNPKLIAAMLQAEAARFDVQRMVYRLVRRGNVELLQMFFKIQKISRTDKFRMVSLALEETLLRRTAMKDKMRDFCNKLILAKFYGTHKITKFSLAQRKQHIKKRIQIICKEVEFLQSYGTEIFTNIDNNFLTSLDIVSENLFAVDLLWKHPSLTKLKEYATWSSLQPNKINYLVQIYVDVLMEKLPDLGLAIDKNLLLDMLSMLSFELNMIYTKDYQGVEEKENFLVKIVKQNTVNEAWKTKYPQVKLTKQHRRFARKHDTKALARAGFNSKQQQHLIAVVHDKKNVEQLRELWMQEFPNVRLGQRAVAWASGKGGTTSSGPFSGFCRRTRYVLKTVNKIYSRVKSYYSLTMMLSAINVIYNISLTEKMATEFGYAACQRVVQIMGELCKNTEKTPNLQGALHKHMSFWSSQSLLDIFHHRRNVVTHGLSLTEVNFRILQNSGELNAGILLAYCQMIQSELQRTYPHLKYFQLCELTRLIRRCLGRVWQLKTLEQRETFATMIDRGKRSIWKDTTAELSNFDQINSLLDTLLSSSEDRQLYDGLKEVKTKVDLAKTKHEEYVAGLQRYQVFAWKLIESCGNYSDKNVLNHSLKARLNLPQMYYSPVNQAIMREANQLLSSIMERNQYSKDTGQHLVELNRLIAQKVDRESQLKKAHQINQFVPFQNERYTERLLESLGVKELRFDKFYAVHDALDSRVYDPLNNQHEVGMFAVEQKFTVIERVLQENDIKYDSQQLDKCQKEDGHLLKRLLEQMLESLHQLSRVTVNFEDQYSEARALARQFGLLEICSILAHTEPFQSNFDYLNTPVPLLAGRYLRNALAHDFVLFKSAFSFDGETLNQTIEVLFELRSSLLNEHCQSGALPHFGEITEKYSRHKRLVEGQTVGTDGKLDKVLNSRLDIYGNYFFIWKGESKFHHNLLDVLLYYYRDDAIAYIEECSQGSGKSPSSSVFSYLWNRLRYSHLLGWPLQTIVKLFSLGGVNTGVMHQDGLADEVDRVWQHLAERMRVPLEDFGYDPPEQVEKILCFFLFVKRFDKFLEFFHRYGEKFDFIKFHNLLSDIPDVVDKLAEFLPWGSAKDQHFSMMHSLCASNNVEALKSAIKRLSSKQLCIRSKENSTPIQTATWNSSFRAIRVMLESRKLTQLDSYTLATIIETHQNDLLKYFKPSLESNQLRDNFLECGIKLVTAGNIDAYRALRKMLSENAFRRVCPDDGSLPLISLAIGCGTKKTFVHQLLADPKLKSTFNRPSNQEKSPFLFDIGSGRFKYTDFLLSNGVAVDFSVIKAVVTFNCFKRLKWLLRKSDTVLTDSQQQEICKLIVTENLDLRMLKCFTGLEDLPDGDLTRMLELTLQRYAFDACRLICETFPPILTNYNRKLRAHPLAVAINGIHRNHSLNRYRPFLHFLIKTCTNIPLQEALLFDALNLGDLQIVQALVDAGVPTDVEVAGFTPLSQAAHNCATYPNAQAYAMFELLLKKGVRVQNLVFCHTHYLRVVRLLELLIEHTSFGASSEELLVILLNAQVIGSERLMQALLRKYRFLAASFSFDRDERLVLDSRFALDLYQYDLECKLLRFIDTVRAGILKTLINPRFGHPTFDYTKLFG